MCLARYLLLLVHCAEHSWSSDIVGSHTAISKNKHRERADRAIVRKTQIATAIQQYVDLPHVPGTDHCGAAAGRQGCSVYEAGVNHALCYAAVLGCLLSVLCAVFRPKKRTGILRVHEGPKK